MQLQAQAWRRSGRRVVLVPTMGALHAGHLSLIRRARKLAGDGLVVVSIYVNPTQFNDDHDLRNYPSPLASDKKQCHAEGVDVVFNPKSLYAKNASVAIEENDVSCSMEGESRPGHFRGVATVVVKIFNLTQTDMAVLGEKDYQQTVLIRRVVRDLDMPVRVVVASTVREVDGLACSSRNLLLSASEREQAPILWRAISLARKAARSRDLRGLKQKLKNYIEQQTNARVEYVEFFDEKSLKPVKPSKGVRLALAVFIGKTRLIDNARI